MLEREIKYKLLPPTFRQAWGKFLEGHHGGAGNKMMLLDLDTAELTLKIIL